MILATVIKGIKIKLDEEILGKIPNIPIIRVRSVKNQLPSVEFMQAASKVGWTSVIGVRKKFLKSKF